MFEEFAVTAAEVRVELAYYLDPGVSVAGAFYNAAGGHNYCANSSVPGWSLKSRIYRVTAAPPLRARIDIRGHWTNALCAPLGSKCDFFLHAYFIQFRKKYTYWCNVNSGAKYPSSWYYGCSGGRYDGWTAPANSPPV